MSSELIFSKNNVNVIHKFQAAKQDRQHLLVVFSGFGAKKRIIYDFTGNTSIGCRSNILWIKDEFSHECAYYLCQDMTFDIEDAIISLINKTIADLSIDKAQVTLMGFSKGATASLYYGLKYDFKNIISSCPRIKIGSALSHQWPSVAKNVMGEISKDKVDLLDNLIPDLLKQDTCLDKNIYLISSPRDELYSHELEPYLHLFWKYSNFNFVFTDSPLAWRHNKITRYNMPIILSIAYAHGEGAYPKFGYIQNGVPKYSNKHTEQVLIEQQETSTLINDISSLSYKDGNIFLNGCAFIKGVNCPQHNDIKQYLIFKSQKQEIVYPLGSVKDDELSYKYFDKVYCNYSCGGLSTIKHQGIDISSLEIGGYQLYVMVDSGGIKKTQKMMSSTVLNISNLIGCDEISIHSNSDGVYVSRRDMSILCDGDIFNITSKKIIADKLFIEGVYAIKGIHLRNWNDADFYLTLVNNNMKYSFKLGMLHNERLNGSFHEFGSYYQKSCFSTIKREGVDINFVDDGEYAVFISMAVNGSIHSKKCSFKILKSGVTSICQD